MNTKTKPIQVTGKNISNVFFTKFEIKKIVIDTDSSIRFDYDKEKLHELAESIRANNNELLQPIVIKKMFKDPVKELERYSVVAGRRRFIACRDILGLDRISAVVKEFEDFESEFRAQFAENEERENWTDYDYVKAIDMWKSENPNMTQAYLAKVFGKTIDWIKKKMQHLGAIQDLSESALSHLSQIPTSHAIELKKLPRNEKEKAIEELAELAKNNLPLPTVKSIRENVSRNIPVVSKKGMSVDIDDNIMKNKRTFGDVYNAEGNYKRWKSTGQIDEQEKDDVIFILKKKITSMKSKLKNLKVEVDSLETELKSTISDSIALQEQQMFPVSKNKEELNHFEIMRKRQDEINKAMFKIAQKKKAGKK